MWDDEARLSVARRYLATGAGLKEAARACRMKTTELDLMLWKALGRKPAKRQPRRMPQMRRDQPFKSRDERFAEMVIAEAKRSGLLPKEA